MILSINLRECSSSYKMQQKVKFRVVMSERRVDFEEFSIKISIKRQSQRLKAISNNSLGTSFMSTHS